MNFYFPSGTNPKAMFELRMIVKCLQTYQRSQFQSLFISMQRGLSMEAIKQLSSTLFDDWFKEDLSKTFQLSKPQLDSCAQTT